MTLPYQTHDLPGVGGTLKTHVEDFEVEEVPAYQPSGQGEHMFLWVEKRDLDARSLVRHVAATLGLQEFEVGCAGQKDKRAVTRQFVSVPAKLHDKIEALNNEQVCVVSATRHNNKLKTGHLRGNRFRVVIRGVASNALPAAQAIAAALDRQGMPNFFGAQRFGRDGDTDSAGLAFLRGERVRVKGRMLRLALSAVQSGMFNTVLTGRLREGTLDQVQLGEVLQVVASGGPFVVDDVAADQPRFIAREVVPAGPMFGPKMRLAKSPYAEREAAVLAQTGLSMDQFAPHERLVRGTRRAMLVWPRELQVQALDDDALVLTTELPRGVYATVLAREFLKTDAPVAEETDEEGA